MLKSLLNGSRFLVFAAVLGALAGLVHKIMVLLKSPKNASTRLSTNGKIPNDFKRSPFRYFDKLQARMQAEDKRRVFKAESDDEI